MGQILNIIARQILDSRGFPTVEVDVITDQGIVGRASVPSGVTTGIHEAVEIRDEDENRYMGKGVLKAVYNVNQVISEELKGFFIGDQSLIDAAMIELDGTDNKSNLGANAILGVSLAVARAAAQSTGQDLYRYIGGVNANTMPIPMINLLNGRKCNGGNMDIREFMIVPIGADSYSDSLRMGVEIYHSMRKLLCDKGYSINVCDEGGFAPDIKMNEEAMELTMQAIMKAGYQPGDDVFISIDVAASRMYDKRSGKYNFSSLNKKLTNSQVIDYWKKWSRKYPIISIEDGLAEDDWDGWSEMNKVLGDKMLVVGDDLFATTVSRLMKGIEERAANAILVKVNQIGTLTEAINAVNLATMNSMNTIISHRSGETEDTLIAELSVALNTGLIKLGSVTRSERIAKYNQLLRIEEALGSSARFMGRDFRFSK